MSVKTCYNVAPELIVPKFMKSICPIFSGFHFRQSYLDSPSKLIAFCFVLLLLGVFFLKYFQYISFIWALLSQTPSLISFPEHFFHNIKPQKNSRWQDYWAMVGLKQIKAFRLCCYFCLQKVIFFRLSNITCDL